MATQKEVRTRIASVKNIQKITRAMEMVAAARLRRAEQRIDAMRPYAQAIRKMTRRVSEAAGRIPRIPLLEEREERDGRRRCSSPATAASQAPSTPRSSARGSTCAASSRATAPRSSSRSSGAAATRA